jgi:hypothetical protein
VSVFHFTHVDNNSFVGVTRKKRTNAWRTSPLSSSLLLSEKSSLQEGH